MLIAAFILFGWALVLLVFKGPRTPLGTALHEMSPGGLANFQAGIQRYLLPDLWDWIFVPILEQPAWVGPALLGVLFVVANSIAKRRAWS